MIDLAALASSATGVVGACLLDAGKGALADAMKSAGSKLTEWFKAKLTDPADAGALAKFQANPESQGAKQMLQGAILGRLEQDAGLVQELADLLKQAGDHSVDQTMTQTGDKNVAVQISGAGNQVNLGKRD